MPGATRSIVIGAPIEKVFAVITDYAKYPEFLTEVRKARVVPRGEYEWEVEYEINVIKNIRYTLAIKAEKPTRIAWTFVRGEVMRDNRGSWTLEEQGPDKTNATYSIELALGPLVPKTIVNALVDTSLPRMLQAFKTRSEALR
jgi:ribosome-associated toxin RatA of RatAB toxin-antitoxin module